jgi:hypothetical protein
MRTVTFFYNGRKLYTVEFSSLGDMMASLRECGVNALIEHGDGSRALLWYNGKLQVNDDRDIV